MSKEEQRDADFEMMSLTEDDKRALDAEMRTSRAEARAVKMPYITCNIYRTPVQTADDAVTIAILNLTTDEAQVLKAIARQIQEKRGSTDAMVGVGLSYRNPLVALTDTSALSDADPGWRPEMAPETRRTFAAERRKLDAERAQTRTWNAAKRRFEFVDGLAPLKSWRMGEIRMASFRGPDYGPLPEGWYREAYAENMQTVFMSPNGQRFVYDMNSNSLRPYPSGFVCANGHPLDTDTSWCNECTRQEKAGTLKSPAPQEPQPRPNNAVENRFSGLDI